MKKILSSLTHRGVLLPLVSVFFLSLISCLNPIGFSPDMLPKIDINLSGEIETTDVTHAVLMLSNRSKTVDVTRVVITQPENSETRIEFEGRPRHLTTKAQYLKPSDKEYSVHIWYDDTKKGEFNKELFATVSTPLPRETYWLYIYRNNGNEVIVDRDQNKDPDVTDSGNPDPQDDDEGEGTIPGTIPERNRNKIGVFVVLNMTRAQDIGKVKFASGSNTAASDYRSYYIHNEPKHGDQQSIGLKQGSWPVTAYYTVGGVEKNTSTKNGVVMPMNDPMSLRTNFMYFYQKKAQYGGGFDITPIWPPVPNDADEDGNFNEEDMVGDGQGILRITNKSETGKVLKRITINGEQNEVTMVKDDVMKFILGTGTVNVSFRPQGQNFDGLTIPRVIKERKITDLAYYDNLSNPDDQGNRIIN